MAGTKPSVLWQSMHRLEQMDGRFDSAWLQDSGRLSLTSNSEALSSPRYKFDSVSCRLLDYVGIARANSGDSSLIHRTDGGGPTTLNSGLPPAEVEPAAISTRIISPLPRVEVESARITNSKALDYSPRYEFDCVSCRLLDYVIARANSGDSSLVHRTDGGGPTTVNLGLPPAEVEPAATTSSLSTATTSSPSKYTWNLAAYRDYLARMRPLATEEKQSVEMLLMEEEAGGGIQIVDEPPDSSDDDDTVHPPFTDFNDLWK